MTDKITPDDVQEVAREVARNIDILLKSRLACLYSDGYSVVTSMGSSSNKILLIALDVLSEKEKPFTAIDKIKKELPYEALSRINKKATLSLEPSLFGGTQQKDELVKIKETISKIEAVLDIKIDTLTSMSPFSGDHPFRSR